MGTRRSRGAATYVLGTPPTHPPGGYPADRAAPCSWAFLSSLRENEFFSNLLEAGDDGVRYLIRE